MSPSQLPSADPDQATHDAAVCNAAEVDSLDPRAPQAATSLAIAGQESINRQVFLLALPMLGEQFFTFLVGFVDTWLAGGVSKEVQAAVGTGAYMGWFVGLIVSLVGTGAAALVSRCIGAQDRDTARRAAGQSLLLAIGLGATMCAVVLALAPWFANQLGQTDESRGHLLTFIRIDALGYPFLCITMVCGGVMRAAGDTRTPMKVQVIVNVVNALLATALVKGWLGASYGLVGIASATAIARTLGGLLMTARLIRGVAGVRIDRASLSPDMAVIARLMRVGLPAAFDAILMAIAQLSFLWVIFHSGDADQATVNAATHMIAMRMEAISFLPAVAWMTAAATLVGQYLGANRPDLAARAGHLASLQAAGLCATVGAGFFFGSHVIYANMSNDPHVQELGGRLFCWMGLIQPLLGMAIVYIGALRGAGDTRSTMFFSLIGSIGLRVPLAYLFAVVLDIGLIGAWIGMWCDNLAKFAMGAWRFHGGRWRRTKV